MATNRHHLNLRGALVVAILGLSVAVAGASHGGSAAVPPPAVATAGLDEDEEHEGRAPTNEELRPSVEAAFGRESYAPASLATLRVFSSARGITLQMFRVGPEQRRTRGNSVLQGVPVSKPMAIGSSRGHLVERVQVGNWPSGLYFARLRAADGRVGFAPFVVRPERLGAHRVAVVLPTLTWQAYNLRDDDGDGRGDSWYADWRKTTVRLGRPFLNRGVPYNFRRYDLPFLRWLAQTGREVDYLSDGDLESVAGGQVLARAYDVLVFPGHHEYVTTHEYDVVERYRDLGGNLMFLSANDFFWQLVRHGNVVQKTKQWRDLGRPEAALIGVQYRGNDRGTHRAPWILRETPASSWAFAGTGLRPGSGFGSGGIEIDMMAPSSPRSVQVLAEIPNLFGRGFTAQMTYYETAAGAKVFAAGAFTLAGAIDRPVVRQLVENVWSRLGSEEPTRSTIG
jgi:hypothetical protein